MDLKKKKLQEFFRNRSSIPKDKINYYIGWINKFIGQYDGNLDDVSLDDVKLFGDALGQHGYEAWQVRQAQEAVLLYVEKFLNKPVAAESVGADGKPAGNKLPVKIWEAAEEIKKVFHHMPEKPKLLLMLIYAGGIRISECIRLWVKDLDFGNYMLVVRFG